MSRFYQTIGCCLVILFIFITCSEDENPIYEELDLSTLSENEFAITSLGDEVKLVVYDCQYNNLQSVTRTGNEIEVIKAFNSMMMLPCVLRYDTIPLGVLEKGKYLLSYLLIDQSTQLADSVYLEEIKQFEMK